MAMIEGEGRRRVPNRRRKELTPEERTTVFFDQDVRPLALALQDRIIALLGSDKRIKVDLVSAFAKADIGQNYKKGKDGVTIDTIPTGRLWAFYLPVRRMRQSLVTAKDRGESGTCVRLVRASTFDQKSQTFVPMPREGDIASYFELDDNEVAGLSFRDPSEVLYLERIPRVERKEQEPLLDSSGANRYLQNLLKE